MRIAVNLRCLQVPKAGIGHYAYNLTSALARTPGVEAVLGCTNDPVASLAQAPFPVVSPGILKGVKGRTLFWEQYALPTMASRFNADILFCPAYVAPIFTRQPVVVTFHDATFITQAKTHRWKLRILYRHFLPLVANRAAKILTDSFAAQSDLVQYLGIPEDRIQVVHLGVGEEFRPLPQEEVRVKLIERWPKLHRPYLLFVGTLEPRKNVTTLIKAYHHLRQRGLDLPLVLAGGKGWMYDQIFAAVQRLGLEEHVVFTGYVPDGYLPLLYNGAAVMVYPSLHEGFGLPPAEAMRCGTPVITSNTSSLPEVVGDAGIMVEPLDDVALAAAIERVLNDQQLVADLRRRGLERAKRFTWERTAVETLKVFQSVVSR